MDFHRLARKDLQSLCKLNKLPANRSNIAMAQALASLTIVNGIENFCGTTESSVPDKNIFMSPKTRRRNRGPVASLHTVQRVYNTRLSARLPKKTLAESENKECVRVEQLSETLNQKIADKDLNLKGTAATYLESKVLGNRDEGLKVDSVETVVEVPSQSIKAVLDMPVPKKKDDVLRDLSLSETDIPPEKQANEDVDSFQKIATAKNDILPDEPVNDDSMIKTESENILFKSNFSAANNMNIVDGVNSDFNLKIRDISCDVNSCGVYDTEEGLPSQYVLSGKPYSENCEGISSHNNSCDDTAADTDVICAKQLDKEAEEHVSENHNCNNSKEIIYKSVMKISSDSSNVFSGGKRSAEGKFIFQKGVGGLTFGVDIQSNTTTYENTENYIIEKNSFNDTEVGLDFLQQNISCKLFDSKREPEVCEILSCNNAKEFFVPSSEMAGSVEYTENVSGAVSSDDELGDKHIFALQEEDSRNVGGKMVVDLETSSKTHAGIEGKSINFQVLRCTYPKDAADQSATPDSYDLSDGFSGEITTYDEKGSGKSSTGTRLLVASDVSCCFLDLENIFADESQPANAEKSPASINPSSCICPSSLPPSLQACEAKNSAEELSETDMPLELQAIGGTNDVGVDSSFFVSEMQTESSNKVEGFQVDAVEAVVEVPSHNNKAAIDLPLPEKKDDVVLELSLSEIDMPPEVQATEGPNDVRVDSSLFGTEIQTESSNRVDGSTYMRAEILNGKDLMYDKQLDKEREHVSENLNCNNTKEIIYQSVMTVSSDSPNVCSGGQRSAEGEIVFQDGVDGLTFGVDMQSNTAKYENTENYTREKNMSSKLFDSNREPKVCKILSCNNSKEFSAPSELAGSIEYTVNFSGAVLSDDELGDKPIFAFQEEVSSNAKEIADQSEMMGEVDSSNTCSGRITSDDENELDFQKAVGEKMVVDLKTSSKTHAGIDRESIISQVLNCTYPKEAADQSPTPDSYDLSDGFAGEITTYGELESDESQPPYVENSPACLKPSICICPSTAPPSLQACGTKINEIEVPLIFADHPFTAKIQR